MKQDEKRSNEKKAIYKEKRYNTNYTRKNKNKNRNEKDITCA